MATDKLYSNLLVLFKLTYSIRNELLSKQFPLIFKESSILELINYIHWITPKVRSQIQLSSELQMSDFSLNSSSAVVIILSCQQTWVPRSSTPPASWWQRISSPSPTKDSCWDLRKNRESLVVAGHHCSLLTLLCLYWFGCWASVELILKES